MNFKIVEYYCNCRYVGLNGTKRSPKCPEHEIPQCLVTLWCQECGKKLEVVPLAGRRIRCIKCSEYQQKKRVQKQINQIRNKNHGIEEEPTTETLREKEERETDVWYQECRDMLNLSLPETPILDSYLGI